MCVLTSNQTNKHFTIRAFLFIPPSRMEERIYIWQCSTVTKNKLLWENIWKVYKQSNRNSKWSFIPMRVVYHIQSIIGDFCPSLFPDCVFPLPYFKGFYFISLLLFGRFSFSFNIRFKVTTSGFKLKKYYNYNKTDSSIMFNYCFIAFVKKVERVNRLGLVC